MKTGLYLSLLFLILIGVMLLPDINRAAQVAAPKPPESEITVSLRDGSTVRGTTSMETVEVQTVYGILTVPMSEVVRLRFNQSALQPISGQDEVDAKAFAIRGAVHLDVLELKTPNGTLKIAKADMALLASAGADAYSGPAVARAFGVAQAALGGSWFKFRGAGSSPELPVYLHGSDPNGEPLAGERLLSTITYEGAFHVYGHEPVPQQNGFDYHITAVKPDSNLRGKRMRVSRVEVSVKGKSNGAVINWDVEVVAGPSNDFGLPAGQFTKTDADPMRAYKINAPIHARFTYHDVNYVRSVIVPVALRKDLALDNGLNAQVFLWTADNRNCNLDIQTVTVRFFGETL